MNATKQKIVFVCKGLKCRTLAECEKAKDSL